MWVEYISYLFMTRCRPVTTDEYFTLLLLFNSEDTITKTKPTKTTTNHTPWNVAYFFIFPPWRCDPTLAIASSFLRLLDHTQRRTTVGRTPLDEWSARRRDLYLTTHNNHNRQTSMPSVGFEPTISAVERPLCWFRPRGHWDRLLLYYHWKYCTKD